MRSPGPSDVGTRGGRHFEQSLGAGHTPLGRAIWVANWTDSEEEEDESRCD